MIEMDAINGSEGLWEGRCVVEQISSRTTGSPIVFQGISIQKNIIPVDIVTNRPVAVYGVRYVTKIWFSDFEARYVTEQVDRLCTIGVRGAEQKSVEECIV
jgi:hypothetical protein